MPTVSKALHAAAAQLTEAGADTPQLDAAVLLAHATGFSRTDLIVEAHTELTEKAEASFEKLLTRRLKREPVAYITGKKEFWSRDFDVAPGVLIPRPDSETLIATLCALVPDKNAQAVVADLGVGSGCLLLTTLAEFPNFRGYGVDVSEKALKMTAHNAVQLGVADRLTLQKAPKDGSLHWADILLEQAHVIISNPPYIPKKEIAALQPEIADYEPFGALDGGLDGLDAYRALIPTAARKLASGGLLLLEVGDDQAPDVTELLLEEDWAETLTYKDLTNTDRVVAAIKK